MLHKSMATFIQRRLILPYKRGQFLLNSDIFLLKITYFFKPTKRQKTFWLLTINAFLQYFSNIVKKLQNNAFAFYTKLFSRLLKLHKEISLICKNEKNTHNRKAWVFDFKNLDIIFCFIFFVSLIKFRIVWIFNCVKIFVRI